MMTNSTIIIKYLSAIKSAKYVDSKEHWQQSLALNIIDGNPLLKKEIEAIGLLRIPN